MFMKENNCVEYKIQKMPCAIHLSIVKEKEQMKKKRNISLSILFWLSGYQFEKIFLTKSRYWKLFRRNFWVFYRSHISLGNYDVAK